MRWRLAGAGVWGMQYEAKRGTAGGHDKPPAASVDTQEVTQAPCAYLIGWRVPQLEPANL